MALRDASSEEMLLDEEFDNNSELENGAGGDGGAAGGEQEDGEGGEEEIPADIMHRCRGYSPGIYRNIPVQPYPIRMARNKIDSREATHTLSAIMRAHLPLGVFNAVDLDRTDPEWFTRVADEFALYYTHDPAQGDAAEARRSVLRHIRENVRKLVAAEKRRVREMIKKYGGTAADYRPAYYSSAIWRNFIQHWADPDFQRRSVAAAAARAQLRNPHTSGSRSFDRRSRDMARFTGKEPNKFTLYLHTHTYSATGEFTSPHVQQFVENFLAACDRKKEDPTCIELTTWAKTVGERKNTILGVPGVKASDILPDRPARPRKRCRRNTNSSSTAISATQIFASVLQRTLAYARKYPDQFDLPEDQVRMLSKAMVSGDSELTDDHPLRLETMQQIIQAHVGVLTDIMSCPTQDKGKALAPPSDNEDSSDDDAAPRPPPSLRPPTGSLKIKG